MARFRLASTEKNLLILTCEYYPYSTSWKNEKLMPDPFFKNNGEIDLLTGSISPNLFNQIVRRDLQLSDRSNSRLSMISINMDLSKFEPMHIGAESDKAIEQALIEAFFKLKQVFRNSDCICRISQLGFWVLVTGVNDAACGELLIRVTSLLPDFFAVDISHRINGQSQLDWYSRIDELHFKK